MNKYIFTYRYNGKRWSHVIYAYNINDAKKWFTQDIKCDELLTVKECKQSTGVVFSRIIDDLNCIY